jgi:hypothetical protein
MGLGFLLSCRVENKSPATGLFYKNTLDKFQWFLYKHSIDRESLGMTGVFLFIKSPSWMLYYIIFI